MSDVFIINMQPDEEVTEEKNRSLFCVTWFILWMVVCDKKVQICKLD